MLRLLVRHVYATLYATSGGRFTGVPWPLSGDGTEIVVPGLQVVRRCDHGALAEEPSGLVLGQGLGEVRGAAGTQIVEQTGPGLEPGNAADFNGDGAIDGIDLGVLLANWTV